MITDCGISIRRFGAKTVGTLASLAVLLLMTGCLYPKENSQYASPKEAVRNVQSAIDQYYGEQGLLPIVNASQDVPAYEKFRLDFRKLQGKGYLSTIPPAAFENGGNYYFLVIDEVTEPLVRLQDIVMTQKVNDLQKQVDNHLNSGGALPAKEPIYPGYYEIDYQALKTAQTSLTSMFTGGALQAMLDDRGTVYVDYGSDIMQQLKKLDNPGAMESKDLRRLLIDNSEFVPVKSPAYRLNGEGEPEPVVNE